MTTANSVRASAKMIEQAIEAFDRDHDAGELRSALLESTRELRSRSDLLTLGTKRPANHIDNSRWLYYDGQMSMTLDEFPKGKQIPPHDHGVWEAIVVCTGRLHHAVYSRKDDGTVPGHAELRVDEDVELTPGQVAMVVPPGDIHAFRALEDSTYVITIVGGEYAPKRHYYSLTDNTYQVRTPKAVRESGVLA